MSSAAARKANLRKGFDMSKSDSLTGVAHIALIDGVVKTLATTQAISRILRAQQDCQIDVWCLVRARKTLWSNLKLAKGNLREMKKSSQPELSRMTKPIAELRKKMRGRLHLELVLNRPICYSTTLIQNARSGI